MNLRELKELFRLVEKTDFTEVEIVQGDLRLRIERGKLKGSLPAPTAYVSHQMESDATRVIPPQSATARRSSESSEKSSKAEEKEKGEVVTSPFVGTFYRAPSPDSDPYVEVGSLVRQGQILCIVEAMKLMNEIECETDGRVVEIYAENGQAVEFGEKLVRVEPT